MNFVSLNLILIDARALPVDVKSESEYNSDGRTKSCVTTFTNLSRCKTFFCSVGNSTLLLRPENSNAHFFPRSCEESGKPPWRCFIAQDFLEPKDCQEAKKDIEPSQSNLKPADILYKETVKSYSAEGSPTYCTNTFINNSCVNYYVCNVENSSSYAIGVGPKEKIEIDSVCGSEWYCHKETDPQAHVRETTKSCKKQETKNDNANNSCKKTSRRCVTAYLGAVKQAFIDHRGERFIYLMEQDEELSQCFKGSSCKEIDPVEILSYTPVKSKDYPEMDLNYILPIVFAKLNI